MGTPRSLAPRYAPTSQWKEATELGLAVLLATMARPPARPTARVRRAITTPVQRTVTNPKQETSRNAPCPCASGKKYKKCCAR